MIQRFFYEAVRQYIPEKIEPLVDSEKLSYRNLHRINPRPGGDGEHIPEFWAKLRRVQEAQRG